ncbi:DcaP family trimeric outer membrane transporter [Pseudomonas profundi]|uniref:DcaP family trimeric outer membrane transporter n=1 Tax=Pseudomonas profundi TaxID=1981513 RepID=UPI0016800486|nr:DcaP family trimeric outer membrane transporter [Pseudomonas profundi]
MSFKFTKTSAALIVSVCFSQAAFAETDEAMQKEINILAERIEALEKQRREGESNATELARQGESILDKSSGKTLVTSEAGVFQVTPNTSVKFGGYLQADVIHDTRFDNGEYFNAGGTPDSSAKDQSNSYLTARQSRLNMLTTTDVGTGTPLQAFFEIDFMGSMANEIMSNSHNSRLRHAYLRYGRYMVGQNWSNFQDFVGYPELLDIASPAGRVFVRQTQFRVDVGQFAFSIENPETQAIQGTAIQAESLGGIGRDSAPDFVASWRGGNGGAQGSYQLSGLLRQLSVDGTVNGVDYDESNTGWGFNTGARWDLGRTVLKANAAYGEGIGRYINNGWANDIRLNDDGSVDLITSWGLSAAVEYKWTPRTASTLSYGHFHNEDDIGAFDTESLNTYRANYRWYPLDRLMVAGEIMHATRNFIDGRDGDNTRFQFSVRKSF